MYNLLEVFRCCRYLVGVISCSCIEDGGCDGGCVGGCVGDVLGPAIIAVQCVPGFSTVHPWEC